ncbi:MAG: DUF2029 domain-containing protein [Planctomycetes bacterium]|nr:DUF2029 domain-containing protein [Planctomycetota bacterium]
MRNHFAAKWVLAGLALVGIHIALAALSARFAYGGDPAARPTLLLVGLLVLGGGVYLVVLWGLVRKDGTRAILIWAIVVGGVFRAAMLFSTPMLEDDYYRYLWDGGVTANGLNPYAYAPADALDENGADRVPKTVRDLGSESGDVVRRVNHPDLRSIYPPVAQAFFALAHAVGPWSLTAWRGVLAGADIAVLALLLVLLRELRLPAIWCVAYWWNPLLVKEIFNSGHLDVIALPFVLGAVLLAIRGRGMWAAVALALAAGVKVWPVALLPLLLRPLISSPKRMAGALLLFIGLIAVMCLPIGLGGLDETSGFVAYGAGWEMNDALFMLFLWGAKGVLRILAVDPARGQGVARIVVALLLLGWTAWLTFPLMGDAEDLCNRCALVLGALFLLSPTQYPWYYTWLLPFLAIAPRASLLLLTALLPLYYLRFYFDARNCAYLFDYGIVWIEYVPVWLMLGWEYRRARGLQAAGHAPRRSVTDGSP